MSQNQDEKIPIKFYNEFWTEDRYKLSAQSEEAVVDFLERLQEYPFSQEIRDKAQSDGKGHFALLFYNNYAVYWSIVTEGESQVLSLLESPPPVRIEVLDVSEVMLIKK